MDSASEWRVIEPSEDETRRAAPPKVEAEDGVPHWLIGAAVAVVGAACALAIWMTLPAGGVTVDATAGGLNPRAAAADSFAPGASIGVGAAGAAAGSSLVVDIEGAVVQPGLHDLPAGSRVGDAITAAGGYAATADIDAAARSLNLAAKLTDGQQIHVPALGEQFTATAPPDDQQPEQGGAPGALIDLNHATADELDTLPGIGPVTAAKIIDARTQAPFATVDELQSRGVVGTSTFEKLRDLVTVTP